MKRRKKTTNSFDIDLLNRYYNDYEPCRYCMQSGADAFHHVISRSQPSTGSILNATPLHNQTCHIDIHGELMQREQQEKFIKENTLFLLKQGYMFTTLDHNFIVQHNLLGLLKSL